jgi:hypothetical protein
VADPPMIKQFDTINKPNINEEEDYEKERIQQFINNEEPKVKKKIIQK